jgi:hypothetical protein
MHSVVNWNWLRFLQTLAAIAAVLIVSGLTALAFGALDALEARRMAAWPSVPGRVVASESVVTQFRGRALRYTPAARIAYEYTIGDTVFTSERVGVQTLAVESGSEEGQRRLRDYPASAAVTVYYDPANPAVAVLERAAPTSGFIAGLWLLGLGLAVVVARWLLRNLPYRVASDE